MKTWAALTVVLYLAALSLLCIPLIGLSYPRDPQILGHFYLYFVPVLLVCQAGLLFVPVATASGRPVKKRSVLASALLGAIPMAVLILMCIGAISAMIWPEQSPARAKIDLPIWANLLILAGLWLFWGGVFYRYFASNHPEAFTAKVTRWLLGGSILEVVVAIPSHIISRHRNECCAPVFSLLGIATGLAVALMAFGPSIFFVFAKRIRQKTGR